MVSLEEAFGKAWDLADTPVVPGGTEFHPQWPEISLRSGVVPYRRGVNDRLEFLLIRRNGHAWWSLPKGRLTPGQSLAQSAEAEAFEEAGVRGRIGSAPLGSCQYHKTAKGLPNPDQLVELVLFPLKVEIEALSWPERGIRQRQWFDREQAPQFLAPGPLRHLLRDLNDWFLS